MLEPRGGRCPPNKCRSRSGHVAYLAQLLERKALRQVVSNSLERDQIKHLYVKFKRAEMLKNYAYLLLTVTVVSHYQLM
jgi:hypothetical protein